AFAPAVLLLALSLAGCGGGPRVVDEGTEVRVGRQTAANVEAKYGVVNDPEAAARITRIGQRLVAQTERPGLPWSFKVLNSKEVNALAAPGGFIYVTRGLLTAVGADHDQLAGVIAHEIAHVTRRHAAKAIEQAVTAEIALGVLLKGEAAATQAAANVATELILKQDYRDGEFEADHDGTVFTFKGGYRANGLLRFLEFLKAKYGDQSKAVTWFGDHPQTSKRITRLKEQLAAMGQPAA
ncbi:MAG: M48 family metalloprotease, partial [Dehalococcoidia bacterium]|nr:M48 family metalloprotease [Dehalococcoidia bacterium]